MPANPDNLYLDDISGDYGPDYIVNGNFATGDGFAWTEISSGGGAVQINDQGYGGVTGKLSADPTIASGIARIQQNLTLDSNFSSISFNMVFQDMFSYNPGDYSKSKFSVFLGDPTDIEIYSWVPSSNDVYINTPSTITITKGAIESKIGSSVNTVTYIAFQVKFG
jgi:hypothetical protein